MTFGINTTSDISKLSQITYNNFEISLVVFMPNITTNHAITYTKSADFTRNFGGKLRQETISKKQPISLGFFWQILLKSINFASIWPALVNVFFNMDNHLLFQQQFARKITLSTLRLVPSFSQRSCKKSLVVLGRCLLVAVMKFQAKFGRLGLIKPV